jgi:hypothetical protein
MTPDLVRLRETFGQLGQLVEALELELVDDPSWPLPSDTSHLSQQDRANPDIMANVEAMAATNRLIAWFGRDVEGYLGLWRGPQELPLERAAVVQLDSEGQYSVVAATIPDYLAVAWSEEAFDRASQALNKVGFTVAASPDVIAKAAEAFDSPNAYRHRLYNEGRVRRGLQPVD